MFNYQSMIKKAIQHFPLWMDIRKRHNTSTGGNFLSSIIDEAITTEEAIQEYIDSYFLYNYIGHEDEVVAFVYMAHVGDIQGDLDKNLVHVFYNNKLFPWAADVKQFEETVEYCYYENGKIYIREFDKIDSVDELTLYYEDLTSTYKIEKTHVWNIFDEFATFVNTRRYENETNKQLADRILYITKNLPNGTEEGLKHAIVSELMTSFPDITTDEIKIKRPTPENLIKAYEDYETLLDMLAMVNRDAFRTKRWDLDYWEYDFESISYIPHVWNKTITDWKNGVGSFNDLEVILADKTSTTNANVYFYKKTIEAFQKYIYDKYIENTIQFSLSKYNDVLNKTNVKYRITASELKDITEEDISLKIYESNRQTTEIPIEDLATGWGKDIEKIENNIIEDINSYRLEMRSKTGYDLIISKADVLYTNQTTGEVEEVLDLMERQAGFVLNSEYELVSTSNKISVKAIENFTKTTGLMNENNYITLADGYSEGEGILSLTNKAGLFVNYNYDCNVVSVPKSVISTVGGYWDDEDFVVRGDFSTENKTIRFSIEANYFSFKLAEDNINARIILTLDDDLYGTTEYDISNEHFFETEKSSTPRKLTFTITIFSIEDVRFNSFMYSDYSIEFSTKNGSLHQTEKGLMLNDFYTNELRVSIKAKTGCSPMLYGIYIGQDFNNIKYVTKEIPYRNGCSRTLEIRTNGIMKLIRLSDNYEIDDYKPIALYKASTDAAYIRLDLRDYESIDSIKPEDGYIETINESGQTYYNLRLKTNMVVGTVTVLGTKIVEARDVPLIDMVRFYIPDFDPTYDKIYCSEASKGLIIGRANIGGTPTNEIVTIGSEAFIGINAIKYTLKMPSTLGSYYGSNNGTSVRSRTTGSQFDYISIYPGGCQMYYGINEYTTCAKNNRFIKLVNNLVSSTGTALNTNKLLFYRVDLFDTSMKDNVIVRFHSENNSDSDIYDLPSWSIGTSNSYIAIQNNIDLANMVSYSLNTYNIDDLNVLSTSIDIKDSYELSNHSILDTEKYIITTDEDVEIKYDFYDGTSKKEHLLKYEEIIIKNDGFNKLNYSNIDTIFHISRNAFEGTYYKDINEYEVLNEAGILVWTDDTIAESGMKVYLVYSIKKPVAFVFGLDYLYKAIDYDVDAYSLFTSYLLTDYKDKDTIALNTLDGFNETDLVYVSCDEPTFEAQLEDGIITFNKYITNNTLLVKTGYYYINGREYYLFSEEETEEIKNHKFYDSFNVDLSGGEMTTYKETNNYISNSEMRLKGTSKLYDFNCKYPLTYGISNLNHITSCETFSDWNSFGLSLQLVPGLNDLGIQFTENIDNGYSFIELTEYLVADESNYLSFYSSKELKTFIGVEEKFLQTIKFNRSLNITLDHEIEYNETDIRYTVINKIEGIRYYLVVQGNGVIDDIILSTDPESVYKAHTKNISLLGFNLENTKPAGTQYRMKLSNHKDYKPDHAGIMSDGSIKTTSSIDWNVTEIKTFENSSDFRKCILTNIGVEDDHIYTMNRDGYLESEPIYIGNIKNIKRLIFKINNINFANMKDFTTTIETSDRYNGDYVVCGQSLLNKFYVKQDRLNCYIRIKIKMPPYKYINAINMLAEYVSSDEEPLKIVTKNSGSITSKVYDLQEVTNCFVKRLNIKDISNINDVIISIRSSRDIERMDVWTDWKTIQFDESFKIKNKVEFIGARFIQFKVALKTRESFITLNSIDLEIK